MKKWSLSLFYLADIYKHTDATDIIATYVFNIDRAGRITKTEVPLIERELNGRKYCLPLYEDKGKNILNRVKKPVLEECFR